MKRQEIYDQLKMTYEELQNYLLQKYGGAICDYFATPECKSKSKKISRTSEGLYCHHMDEDKGVNLGNSISAKSQPFEWQKKERLVYCNVLEHLILHIKIAVLRQKELLKKPNDVSKFFTTDGIFMLCEEINDMFVNDGTSVAWKKRCFDEIKENYEDYILLVRTILAYIDDNYASPKDDPAFLVVGSKVHFADGDGEIVKVTKKRDKFLLKLPNGDEKVFSTQIASRQFKYIDEVNIVTRKMASGYDCFYENIYNDIVNFDKSNEISECKQLLRIDYTGYVFSQFSNIVLTKDFGAKTADEYIAKALPMYCDTSYDLNGKTPIFWKGTEIKFEQKDFFYIIRLKTMFDIKGGKIPFIRYRERDLLRCPLINEMSDTQNFKNKGWTILSTSDVFDKKTNTYYSQYKDAHGGVVDATVILTLGKEDYLLFKEYYDIRYLKILDGCYFS